MKVTERRYCFHGLLHLRVRATSGCHQFFDEEYGPLPACPCPEHRERIEVVLQIGGAEPRVLQGSAPSLGKTFKRLLRLKYSVAELRETKIWLWVDRHPLIDLAPGFALPVVQTHLLEPVLYWKLMQEGVAIFHAATLARDGHAVAILGRGGVGKTSSALRLIREDPSWSFMGDDLVFARPDRSVYAYPRPLHLFRHHLDMPGILEMPLGIKLRIYYRDYLRRILSRTLGQEFFFATRVPVKEIFASLTVAQTAKLSVLCLLEKSGDLQELKAANQGDREEFVATSRAQSDLRAGLYDGFPKSMLKGFGQREELVLSRIYRNVPFVCRIGRDQLTVQRLNRLFGRMT